MFEGDEEVWMEDENIFAVDLLHEKKRRSIKKSKVRETQGANENMQGIEDLENQIVLLQREERSSEQIQGEKQGVS